MSNAIRSSGILLIASVMAWWLFGDTYHKYAAVDQDVPLRFAHFGSYEDFELWRSVIADFRSRRADVRIHQEYVVGGTGHYTVKLRQQALAGALPDVALIQLGPFAGMSDHFADLGALLAGPDHGQPPLQETLNPGAVAAFRVHGIQKGIPVSGGNLAIYLNRTCFDRAAAHRGQPLAMPDSTWSMAEFHRTARALTYDFDGDGHVDQFGFWLPRWIYYLPFIWSFGADVVDDDGVTWMLRGARAVDALTFYRSLATGDRVCPRAGEVPQLYQDTGFLTGRVAMCVNGPWFEPFLRKTTLADKYIVLEIPSGPGGRVTRITWDAVVMRAGLTGVRRDHAAAFVRFLLSHDVQTRIAQSGRAFPARSDCLEAFVAGDARRRAFVDAIPHSRLQPMFTHFAEVDRAINRMLQRLTNESPNVSVVDELDALAHSSAVVRLTNSDKERASQ